MTQQGRRDFVKYSFYKVSPEWRRLPEAQRTQSKTEFAEVLAEFSDRIAMASYSLVGTRGDVDFMLWKISPQLEPIDDLMGQLNKTELGKYLAMPHSYLAMTRRSPYVDTHQLKVRKGPGRPCASLGVSICSSIPSSRPTSGTSCPRKKGRR